MRVVVLNGRTVSLTALVVSGFLSQITKANCVSSFEKVNEGQRGVNKAYVDIVHPVNDGKEKNHPDHDRYSGLYPQSSSSLSTNNPSEENYVYIPEPPKYGLPITYEDAPLDLATRKDEIVRFDNSVAGHALKNTPPLQLRFGIIRDEYVRVDNTVDGVRLQNGGKLPEFTTRYPDVASQHDQIVRYNNTVQNPVEHK